MIDSSALTGLARITWQVRDGQGLTFVVQRRHADQPWKLRATLTPDGTGRIALEDNAVLAGEPYTYGVVATGEKNLQPQSIVTVDIPR